MQQLKIDYLVKKESTQLETKHPYRPIDSVIVDVGVGYVDIVRQNNKHEQVQDWLNKQARLMNKQRSEQDKKLFRYVVRAVSDNSESVQEEE